jgi:kinesin family protein 11
MGHMGKEVLLQTGPMSVSNKTYTFDRVFGAESDQEMMYDGVAKPVLQEMLQGYNCTIFAYGQTGTGKTYTMSGDIQTDGRLSPEAGIIPRTLMGLFKDLEKQTEYSVKISFIELYNEELKDLLLINDQEERKVRIFEDPAKKSIVVQGMEEVYIKNAAEGMKLLSDGSYKRHVASTQCNDLSSRSHSVFTITVHMKEVDPISGEEYLKIGKLNLVDLAGSENINRSGADNKRAREAGMINQSLLTLGRVINALVDQSSHIPYRESKLTRLLQDSLGGKTKTCIIATISPAKVSLDETISTLEYANRAKSIKNKPQINQTMSKKLLIREYVQEIERLRNDLNASRNKNGIYLTEENWERITAESESRRIQVEEQKLRLQVLEEQIKKYKHDFEDNLNQMQKSENELILKKIELNETKDELNQKSILLEETLRELDIEKLVNDDHKHVERKLRDAYKSLMCLTDEINLVKDQLFDYIDRQNLSQMSNSDSLEKSKEDLTSKVGNIRENIESFRQQSLQLTNVLNEDFDRMIYDQGQRVTKTCDSFLESSKSIERTIDASLDKFLDMIAATDEKAHDVESVKENIKNEMISELKLLQMENRNFTVGIQTHLGCLTSGINESFESINSKIQDIIGTVVSQLNAQADEVDTLKNNLLKHQQRYSNALFEQTSKLIQLKETEESKSRESSHALLNKIAELIETHESSKTDRLNKSVDSIHPELSAIQFKTDTFSKKFGSFIEETWAATQKTFASQLSSQSTLIQSEILNKHRLKNHERVSDVENELKVHTENDHKHFQQVLKTLSESMTKLSDYSAELKELNQSNRIFTTSQLKTISHSTDQSISDIAKQFESYVQVLESIKPSIIENFSNKNNSNIKLLHEISSDKIQELKSSINEIAFDFDIAQPLPKKQKLDESKIFPHNLPKSKSRDEILQLFKPIVSSNSEISTPSKESLGESNFSERPTGTPVPIPDRKRKSRVLSETSINSNLQKPKHSNSPKLRDESGEGYEDSSL